MEQRIYVLENLNCAHCAGKIERAVAETEGYDDVSFTFATKQLRFYSDKENTLAEIQQICDSIEDGVTVRALTDKKPQKRGIKPDVVLLIAAAVFGAAALALHLIFHDAVWAHYTVLGLSLVSAGLAGWKVFYKGVRNLFKLRIDENLLMTIAVIAAFILGEYVEAAMVAVLFSLGEIIEDVAVNASRRDIEKLSKIRPDTATVLSHGKETEVAAESVAVGSTLIVKPHERVPLDGVILEGSSQLDLSALTGESLPVEKSEGDEALSGAINGEGLLKLRTTKAFGDSTAARILRLVEDAAAQKGNRERLISRFAAVYTPVVVGLAILIAVLPPLFGLGSFSDWIYKALCVLVASCPCAIVISVPLAYFAGIGAASRVGVLVKGGKYLEALAEADAFGFDKTGTLTTGRLEVTEVFAEDDYNEQQVLDLAAACEKHSAHPIARAICSRAANSLEMTDYREIAGRGTSAEYRGQRIEVGGARLLDGKIPDKYKNLSTVFVTADGRLVGAIVLRDAVRPEAKEVVARLKDLGVKRNILLTGDSSRNALEVARELGLDDCRAELLPENKLRVVNETKKSAKAMCFVGDGINDAPVLSASDCGIAMGLGSEAAIEAADAVLSAGNLSALPAAIKLARKAMNTIRVDISFALAVKAAVIILACLGLSTMWMSVVADTGVCVLCVLYTARLLRKPVKSK